MKKLLSLRWGLVFAAAAAAASAGLTGCGETTDTEIVRYKEQDSEARMVEAGEYEDIRSQVDAPQRYQTTLHDQDNMMFVNVDANIQVPDAEGIRLKKVEARPFVQEDYDAVHKAVMENADTWTGGFYLEDGQIVVTRDEFMAKLKDLEIVMEKLEKGDAQMLSKYSIDSVKEQLKYYYQLLETSPGIFETEAVDIEVRYNEDVAKKQWYMSAFGVSAPEAEAALRSQEAATDISGSAELPAYEENQAGAGDAASVEEQNPEEAEQYAETEFNNEQNANFIMNDNHYTFRLNNSLSEYSKYITMEIERYGKYFSEVRGMDDEEKRIIQNLTLEEAERMAGETLEKMGIEDMVLALTREGYTYEVPNEAAQTGAWNDSELDKAYSFIYTRVIDGVPIGQTSVYGSSYDIQGTIPYSLYWPFECIELSYDAEGLLNFAWVGPYEISELSDEYVFLLPFSEIQNIFESIILKKNADYADQGLMTEMTVDKVTLSYMRIWEDSARGDATLIPVWNFFGSYNLIEDSNEKGSLIPEGMSLLTINAMDGTIVDIERGY